MPVLRVLLGAPGKTTDTQPFGGSHAWKGLSMILWTCLSSGPSLHHIHCFNRTCLGICMDPVLRDAPSQAATSVIQVHKRTSCV